MQGHADVSRMLALVRMCRIGSALRGNPHDRGWQCGPELTGRNGNVISAEGSGHTI